MLEHVQLPILWYIVILIISIIALILFGLYILSYYYLGKPMAPFLDARIKRWTDKNAALFEIIDITGNVSLVPATHETGGYRRTPQTVSTKKPFTKSQKKYIIISTLSVLGIITLFSYYNLETGLVKSVSLSLLGMVIPVIMYARQPQTTSWIDEGDRPQPLIMPTSVYTINTVPTIPLIDLHPQLHPDILQGLEKLVADKVETLDALKKKASGSPDDELIPGYTYGGFYELFEATRQKYEFMVRVSDVADAIQKNFDKNFRESIEGKEFNQKSKRRIEQKYALLGYLALLLVVLGVMFKLIYVTIYGGGS